MAIHSTGTLMPTRTRYTCRSSATNSIHSYLINKNRPPPIPSIPYLSASKSMNKSLFIGFLAYLINKLLEWMDGIGGGASTVRLRIDRKCTSWKKIAQCVVYRAGPLVCLTLPRVFLPCACVLIYFRMSLRKKILVLRALNPKILEPKNKADSARGSGNTATVFPAWAPKMQREIQCMTCIFVAYGSSNCAIVTENF